MKAKMRKVAVAMATLVLLAGCGSAPKQLSQQQQPALGIPKAEAAELSQSTLPRWMWDADHTVSYNIGMDGQADSEETRTENGQTANTPMKQAAEDGDRTATDTLAEKPALTVSAQADPKQEQTSAKAECSDRISVDSDKAAQAAPTQADEAQDESPAMTEQAKEMENLVTEEVTPPKNPSIAESQAEPVPQPAPEEAPVENPPTQADPVTSAESPAPVAYGAVPFSLAEGTGKWWHIDATDSAYWAVAEQINAMRAAGGLEPLAMDETLSATASSRCESFVAGGPFDHSGMVTRSEICASGGPLGSAAAVCAAWQASEAHYANIMEPSFTRMGVSCWFCAEAPMQMTYWTVTLE